MYRFEERQAVTAFSFLLLCLTSLTSLTKFMIHQHLKKNAVQNFFWLICAIGFFVLGMDEYFMMHEGIDNAISRMFNHHENLERTDNIVLAVYGLVAGGICAFYFKHIKQSSPLLLYLILGAFGLAGTIVLHAFEEIHINYKVAEECAKMIGVSFFFTGFFLTLRNTIKSLPVLKNEI